MRRRFDPGGSLRRLERLLLPAACAFCRAPLAPGEVGACEPCRGDLPANRICCPGCAEPLAADPGAASCARCQSAPLPLETVIAPLRYAYPVDAAIRAIKFRRRLEFVPVFAGLLATVFEAASLDVDCLVPVPLHWLRHGRRGFNQAAELARPIALAHGLPVSTDVVRARRTARQAGLDARRRQRNLRRAFRVRDTFAAPRHALLVDDVMTTGSTLAELARCLSRHGVERVSALVVARAAAAQPGAVKV